MLGIFSHKYLIFLYFSFLTSVIFGEDAFQLIKKITVGKEEGLIGYGGFVPGGAGIIAPRCFAISKNGNIFIPDTVNSRINIYDLDLNYLRTIKFTKDDILIKSSALLYAGLLIDDLGNLIFFPPDEGII